MCAGVHALNVCTHLLIKSGTGVELGETKLYMHLYPDSQYIPIKVLNIWIQMSACFTYNVFENCKLNG